MLHLKRFGWDMSGSGKARKMGKAVGFGETLEIPRGEIRERNKAMRRDASEADVFSLSFVPDAITATRRTPEPIRYKLFGGESQPPSFLSCPLLADLPSAYPSRSRLPPRPHRLLGPLHLRCASSGE
jgi:hypothetical protein